MTLPRTDPFAAGVHPVLADEPSPAPAGETAVLVEAPAGGPVLVVVDEELARSVLTDARIVKDPAWAPVDWDPRVAELEQTAAEQPSLTTLDGPEHVALRRAHAPLFTARRLRDERERIAATAREVLSAAAAAGGTVDLMADVTTRYPLTVLLDLLGVPRDEVDRAAAAALRLLTGDYGAIAVLADVAESGLRAGDNRCTELGARLPDGASRADLRYHLFGMIFAGQLTTDIALGEVLLAELRPDADPAGPAERVEAVLREHPPAPFGLWRFARDEVDVAGYRLAPRTPVLVDLRTIGRAGGSIAFGAGPHVCVGAQLARTELQVAVEVLRSEFPDARLDADVADLSRRAPGGTGGPRLVSLPVRLRG